MRRLSAALLTLAATGCGIGFNVTDGDKDADKDFKGPEVAQTPKPLLITQPGQKAVGNEMYAKDVGTLTAAFDYTADTDRTLRLAITDFKRKHCADAASVVPDFTWREGEGGEQPFPVQTTVTAAAGKTYQLALKAGTSFGACDEILVRFEMRDVTGL